MKYGNIRNIKKETLSKAWYRLYRYTFDYQKEDGEWETQQRETYDRGNGAAILLYNPETSRVVLTRQFRMPTYVNGNPDGMMVEVCAGLLEGDDPESCIIKEVEEETGYKVEKVEEVFQAYMSPGAVTEKLYFFLAEYNDDMKISAGGGAPHESEHIEVLEVSFDKALAMIQSGEIIDAKSILLLQYARIKGVL
ncbi:NUDIX domain-containing protein [Lentiprolixibacter aurantiacus]|uniref:GDP-mannose pyrophosphatase n=1 Tax=Lentiprolixibacter aurantiacus TaxID=2993939 RepID=A0AAE3SP41_9FLAO|nr:NUDIX domain-containing protein [Lentiprolixibacter aurantiacus]MCX2720299.1 NUDIX domain-containing protein [Lentiprolixibacter aurantiacus]